MSVSKSGGKQEKQLAVSKAVLEVIEKDGLLGVTHSKVARRAGVSRAWIYEYIGKDKNSLIEHAAEVLGQFFVRSKKAPPEDRAQLSAQLKDAVEFLFEGVGQDPAAIKIYFRFRGTKTPLGQVIRKYEDHWLETAGNSARRILGLPEEQGGLLAELVLTLRLAFAHRLATSSKPQLARERAEKIFELMHGLIGHL